MPFSPGGGGVLVSPGGWSWRHIYISYKPKLHYKFYLTPEYSTSASSLNRFILFVVQIFPSSSRWLAQQMRSILTKTDTTTHECTFASHYEHAAKQLIKTNTAFQSRLSPRVHSSFANTFGLYYAGASYFVKSLIVIKSPITSSPPSPWKGFQVSHGACSVHHLIGWSHGQKKKKKRVVLTSQDNSDDHQSL